MYRLKQYIPLLSVILFCAPPVFGQKGSLSGQITDRNGAAVPGVLLSAGGHQVFNGFDGSFELKDLDTGRLQLSLFKGGWDTLLLQVRVLDKENTMLGQLILQEGSKQLKGVQIIGAARQGSDIRALTMTRKSDKVVTVVSAESIGKMPDKNAADALQRVAGAAVQKSKGEGNSVSLRGTPEDWTATLINGNRIPTANEVDASRVFDFQVFAAKLIDYIVVTRTVTPDIEGDNVGGAINFLTRSAVTERTLQVDLAGGYSLLARKPAAELNILWGDVTKSKKFSYLINASYYARAYAADAPLLAYGTNFNHSLARLELKRYTGERYTSGINTAVEYKPNEHLKIGASFLYGRLVDEKWQQKTMYNWSDGSGARIRLQNIHGILDNELYNAQLHAEWQPNDRCKLETRLATLGNRFEYGSFPFSKGDSRNGYTTVEFISPLLEYTDMTKTNFFGGKYDPNNPLDPNPYPYKLLDIDNPYGDGGDNYRNIQPKYQQLGQPGVGITPGEFYLSGAFADQNRTWERDPLVAQLDGTWNLGEKVKLKSGLKYRMKEGQRQLSYYEWRLVPGVGKISLDNFQTMDMDPHQDFLSQWGNPYKGTFMPFLTRDQMHQFMGQYSDSLSGKVMDSSNNNYQDWVGSQYRYREQVAAAYLMAEAHFGRLSLTGGLRLEHTQLKETSDTLVQDDFASIGVRPEAQHIDRSYLAVLPALNAVYAVNEFNNIRGAVSRTFHRPNFQETKPGAPIWQRENFIRIFGNPDLKPAYSLNLDLMYEHYWGNKGMWSLGGYYKLVTDHIFISSQADDNPFSQGVMNKTFLNADRSFVAGFEAMLNRKFDFLPGILGGFGVNANMTWAYSEMNVPGRPEPQAMTEQAPLLYNVALFYERKRMTARLGLNYRGAFTTDINMAANPDPAAQGAPLHLNTDYDLFMGAAYSLDFQFAYKFNQHFSAYLELNNLTDAPYRTYIGRPERPLRTEYYKQKGMIGMSYRL